MKINFTKAMAVAFAGLLGVSDAAGTQLVKAGADGAATQAFVHKDAAGAIRKLRLAAEVSEKAAATALGIEDVEQYVQFESGGVQIEINAGAIQSLAKLLKVSIPDLAVAMLAPDGSTPAADPNATPDPDAGVAKSTVHKMDAGDKGNLPSGQHAPFVITKEALEALQAPKSLAKSENLIKGILGLDPKVNLQKDQITPQMFAVNSTLTPDQGQGLLSLMVDQSSFLKKIQVKPMTSLMQNVNVWDVGGRKARNYTPGHISDRTKFTNGLSRSLTLTARKVNFIFSILDETVANWQGNIPGLEAEVIKGMNIAFMNEILDLSFNGTSDGDGTTWLSLTKGWLKVAVDALTDANVNRRIPAAQVLDVTTGGATYDSVQKIMDALISAGVTNNPSFFDPTTPFVLGPADLDRHEVALLSRPDAMGQVLAGTPATYRRRPLEVVNFLATKNILHTKLENFVLGVVTGGSNGIVMERIKVPQATDVYVTMYIDQDFVNRLALALAVEGPLV